MNTFQNYRVDLHVHTVLSPCAEIEMIPPLIVQEAIDRGINIIAITDHNASGNVEAVQKAAEGSPLTVLAGMELQTKEEVHVLCLFDSIDQLSGLQTFVNRSLPEINNRPDFFGEQLVVDQNGDYIRREEQLLITSVNFSIDQAWKYVEQLDGLLIPAHIDRKVNGLLGVLGLVPTGIPFIAMEISSRISPENARNSYPQIRNYPLIQNGDVHRLSDFCGSTHLFIQEKTISEIKMALRNQAGRSFKISQ